jgi:hypothetical protein
VTRCGGRFASSLGGSAAGTWPARVAAVGWPAGVVLAVGEAGGGAVRRPAVVARGPVRVAVPGGPVRIVPARSVIWPACVLGAHIESCPYDGASNVACLRFQPGGARRRRPGAPARQRLSPVPGTAAAKTAGTPSAMIAMSSPVPPSGRGRPLPRLRISWSLPSAPRVPAAIAARAPAGPAAARRTLKCFTGEGEGEGEAQPRAALAGGDAETRAALAGGDAETRAALADAVVPARMAVGTEVTISATAAPCVAACSGAPASPRKPLPRVIISVVSCRVQAGDAVALARNGMLGHAATAQSRTCRTRLRGERAPDSGDLPRIMRPARAPTVIRLFARASAQVPPAAGPQTYGVQGPRWPPTAGNYTESKLQPRCGESIQAGPHRAADWAAQSLSQRDGYPLRDPRARSIATGSRRRWRGQPPSIGAGVRRGMPSQTAWHLLSGRLNGVKGSPGGRLAVSQSTGSAAAGSYQAP